MADSIPSSTDARVSFLAFLYSLAGSAAVEWTHLGDGPQLAEVERLLAERPSNLTVDLRGQVAATEVYQELLQGLHHALVNLSLSEGAPVSLMEASVAFFGSRWMRRPVVVSIRRSRP